MGGSDETLALVMPRKPKKLARLGPAPGEWPANTRFSSHPIEEFGDYGGAFLRAVQIQRRSLLLRKGTSRVMYSHFFISTDRG